MKKLIITLTTLIVSLMLIPNVHAAGNATISVTPSSKTVVVGNSVTLTVTVSASSPIAAIDYTVQYDSSILSLSSTTSTTGGARNVDAIMNNTTYKKSYTYTFKVKKSGTATVSITGAEIRDSSSALSVRTYSSIIKCLTQQQLEDSYSKNNNLSSLGIEGYELSPVFSANQTEYTVELAPETEKINIIATKADNTASINGIGEITVSEGLNVLKVEVTAQNGQIKTYTINATVRELDPITLEVDGVNYSVVRSKKALNFTNTLFIETTTQINGNEVPAYYNEITNTTLIGLKNSEGLIKYFRVKDDKYIEYKELTFGSISIMVLDYTNIPYGYQLKMLNIKDNEYKGYVTKDTSRFALIYGVNLQNGNEGFYNYDNYEGTLQRFDIETNELLEKNTKKTSLLLYVFIGSTSCLFILLLISLFSKNKSKKNKTKVEKKKEIKELDQTKEFKLGHTHDLKEELELAKKQISEEKVVEDEEEKDIFDEMEEKNNKEKNVKKQ